MQGDQRLFQGDSAVFGVPGSVQSGALDFKGEGGRGHVARDTRCDGGLAPARASERLQISSDTPARVNVLQSLPRRRTATTLRGCRNARNRACASSFSHTRTRHV